MPRRVRKKGLDRATKGKSYTQVEKGFDRAPRARKKLPNISSNLIDFTTSFTLFVSST